MGKSPSLGGCLMGDYSLWDPVPNLVPMWDQDLALGPPYPLKLAVGRSVRFRSRSVLRFSRFGRSLVSEGFAAHAVSWRFLGIVCNALLDLQFSSGLLNSGLSHGCPEAQIQKL